MEHEPTIVILAPRMTDDSVSVWRTCIELGWTPERLQGWRVPEGLLSAPQPVIIYGEPLFAEAVADQMGLVLLEPSIEWLTQLPHTYTRRAIELTTLRQARTASEPYFVKPADGKIFEPKVYSTGVELPSEEHVDQDIPVLRSEVVDFLLEIRCFVRARQVVTMSPYWRNGVLANRGCGDWSFEDGEEDAALRFATCVLADDAIPFPPSATLDVG